MDLKSIFASSAPNGNDAPATTTSTATAATAPPRKIFQMVLQDNPDKMFNIMRFRHNSNLNFAEWRDGVKLEREKVEKEVSHADEKIPEFGAGSEYGNKQEKYGAVRKEFKRQEQPLILTAGGEKLRTFKGTRLGGVNDHASYYLLKTTTEGTIDAISLEKWYDFKSIQTYKSLTAEEAEEEFGRRTKVLNFFELMLRKRLSGETEGMEEPKELKVGKQKSKELDTMDSVEYMNTDDEDSDSDEGNNQMEETKKGKRGHLESKKKRTYAEAFDESDDGDDEGREIDYVSSSSESQFEPDAKVYKKSVAEGNDFDEKNYEKGGKESQTSNQMDAKDKKHAYAIDLKPSTSGILAIKSYQDDDDISEESVRRYLLQKPRTAKDIMKKFKKKKVGMSNDVLLDIISNIIHKLNPTKKDINNKLYLSIEPPQ